MTLVRRLKMILLRDKKILTFSLKQRRHCINARDRHVIFLLPIAGEILARMLLNQLISPLEHDYLPEEPVRF